MENVRPFPFLENTSTTPEIAAVTPPGTATLEVATPEGPLTVGALARSAMRRQLEAIVALEPLVRAEGTVDAVHDTRVAIRRLRAALSLFKGALSPRTKRFRDELRWIARAYGKVRDLDVQREEIARAIEESPADDRAGLEALDALLAARRQVTYGQLLRTLDLRRYEHLKQGLGSFLKRPPALRNQVAALPAAVVMPELIAKRYRATRKRGRNLSRTADSADLHALRIRCKRLRYALEIVTPLYPDPAETLIKRLVRLQDVLGEIHDADVAIATLQELGRRAGRRLPNEAVFAMGRLAERQNERGRVLRKRFSRDFAAIEGKRWKALKREMERRRSAGAVPMMS